MSAVRVGDQVVGVPGEFPLARCKGCDLLDQNPRVPVDQLGLAYPPDYPAHACNPELGRIVRQLDRPGSFDP